MKTYRQTVPFRDYPVNTIWVEVEEIEYITPGMLPVRRMSEEDGQYVMMPVKILKPLY